MSFSETSTDDDDSRPNLRPLKNARSSWQDAYVARHSSAVTSNSKITIYCSQCTTTRVGKSKVDASPKLAKMTITPQIPDCNHTILTSVTIVPVYGASLMQGSSRWWSTDRNNINDICSWSVVAKLLSRRYFFFDSRLTVPMTCVK